METTWEAGLNGRLYIAEAAERVASEKRLTPLNARKVLIAALIDEQLTASCESYWRDSNPPLSNSERKRRGHVPYDAGVPADFWRMQHAVHFDWSDRGGLVPTGSWGCWAKGSRNRFSTDIELTGYAAAGRYPDFADLAVYGSRPVTLSWAALEVSLHSVDVDRLISVGGFTALRKRAERKSVLRWGNTSKSDALRVIARWTATLTSDHDLPLLLDDPALLMRTLKQTADQTSEELAVSNNALAKFAQLFREEASYLQFLASAGPPPAGDDVYDVKGNDLPKV